MNYPRITHAVFHSPWALQRAWFGTIFSLLHSRAFAGEHSALARAADAGADPLLIAGALARRGRSGAGRFGRFRYGHDRSGRLVNHSAKIHALALKRAASMQDYQNIVAEEEDKLEPGQLMHIFGQGIIGKHLSSMDELCSGGLSLDRIQGALADVKADDKVAGTMLQLDTPGGVVYGATETNAQIRALRELKPVGTFCDSLDASCGFWLTSAAEFAYLTASAEIGCVGVYTAHIDYEEYCKKEGIGVTLLTDGGTHKAAGAFGTKLTDEQKALILEEVAAHSAQFKADVRAGRGSVGDAALQGQCFTGAKAVAANFADAVVPDLESALNDLAQNI